MTPEETYTLRLNHFTDARVRMGEDDVGVIVEFRSIGGTEPIVNHAIRLEDLGRVLAFAEFHSTGGQR